jgi:hypothetical protein
MKRFHLIFGWLLFLVFLLTGQYMDRFHNHLAEMMDGPRMLYRSRHIFILLTALLHLGIGSYFVYRKRTLQRGLQFTGSALITISPVLLILGFFIEPKLPGLETPYSHWAMYLVAFGTLLHFLSGIENTS